MHPNVPQFKPCTSIGSGIVRFHLSELQKEPSNFSNPHAKLKTVADRVESKLKAAIVAVCQLPPASILHDLAERVEQFCNNSLLPVLNRYDVQGEHRDLITTLNRVISERCPAQTANA